MGVSRCVGARAVSVSEAEPQKIVVKREGATSWLKSPVMLDGDVREETLAYIIYFVHSSLD